MCIATIFQYGAVSCFEAQYPPVNGGLKQYPPTAKTAENYLAGFYCGTKFIFPK
jgi:hypothetical protein